MRKLFIIVFILAAYWPYGALAYQPPDTLTLTIVSVNDMHARIDNFPGFISWLDSIRSRNEHVLVLSAGDNFTGNPVVDQYPDKGYPIIELMNMAGFNYGAIGNHEFDYGQETLKKRLSQADFPLMAANIVVENDALPEFKPYGIFYIDDTKLCIFSMVQVNEKGIPDTHPSKLTGLKFTPPLEYVPTLKKELDSCGVLIALTHLGLETDVELANAWQNIDWIAGGHSHTLIKNPTLHNGVLITQAGAGLKYATVTTLKVLDDKVVHKSAILADLSGHKGRNAAADSLLSGFNDNPELKQTIGKATAVISGKQELGNLTTDAMTAVEPIEIAFQNTGGIRIGKIERGDITVSDIYSLDPFGNEIILIQMTPDEIRSLLLNSYNRGNSIDLIPSGVHYTIVTDESNRGKSVELTLPDGKPLNENNTYNVGVSSYIASSYTFDHKDPGTSLYMITAEALINFIKSKGEIDYTGSLRTRVNR
ncbi:MAG: bifunctional UDP-sugar hydrolase/5'-nucleotidase [Lentimicrobiaceae bacterium]|nr:bifunctional UDP-sugar hydrolase/5'-nucleotidase [Lentimicrobiaceae bacterium]